MRSREKLPAEVLKGGEPASSLPEHRAIYLEAVIHGREHVAAQTGLSKARLSQILAGINTRYALEASRKAFPYPREWSLDNCYELPVSSRAILKAYGFSTLGQVHDAVERGDLDLDRQKHLGRPIANMTKRRAAPIQDLLRAQFGLAEARA